MSQKGKMTVAQSTKVRFIAKTKASKKAGMKATSDKGKRNPKVENGQKQKQGKPGDGPSIGVSEVGTNANRIEDIKKAFALFDKDGNGCISKEEVMDVLSGAGVKFSTEQLNLFMSKLDKDGDGEVDYDEFCNLMKDVVVSTPSHHDISEAFKAIDVNSDGTITKAELQTAIGQFGGNLSDSEANDVMAVADRNGDGEIDFEEFMTLLYLLDLQPQTED